MMIAVFLNWQQCGDGGLGRVDLARNYHVQLTQDHVLL
jgi:hypothetical protein